MLRSRMIFKDALLGVILAPAPIVIVALTCTPAFADSESIKNCTNGAGGATACAAVDSDNDGVNESCSSGTSGKNCDTGDITCTCGSSTTIACGCN